MNISAGTSMSVPSSEIAQDFLPGTWFVGYWQVTSGATVMGNARTPNGWNVADVSGCICVQDITVSAELNISAPSNAVAGAYTATCVVCTTAGDPLPNWCINSVTFNVVAASTMVTNPGPSACID